MKYKTIFLALTVSLLAVGYGAAAKADSDPGTGGATVLTSESVLLGQSDSRTTTLVLPGPGELFVTVTDLEFPTSFASLQYSVTAADGVVLPPTAADTTTTINLTAATTLYANVFATVGPGGAGLYNLTATFVSAVPLPGSFGLFAGGALLIALKGRRRASRALRATVPA